LKGFDVAIGFMKGGQSENAPGFLANFDVDLGRRQVQLIYQGQGLGLLVVDNDGPWGGGESGLQLLPVEAGLKMMVPGKQQSDQW